MITSNSPHTWSAPNWHPDFGDANIQLKHLQNFSLQLNTCEPDAKIILETPEMGLMYVLVELSDGTMVEVYSVPCKDTPEKRRLALFFGPDTSEEKEVYAKTIESALTYFEKR